LNGRVVVPSKYDEIDRFHWPYTTVKSTDKKGNVYTAIIDTSGRELIRTDWEDLHLMYYDSTLVGIRKNGQYGVMDLDGNVLVEPVYAKIESEKFGSAIIGSDGSFKYVIERDGSGRRTQIGPDKHLSVRSLQERYLVSAITSYTGNNAYDHVHIFDTTGRHLGDFSGGSVSDRIFGQELPAGYIAFTESKDAKPYVVQLESGYRFKAD
jgi:hypothetical protein